MTSNWYAVYTRPHKERKVASLLSKRGIENFCPFINVSDSNRFQNTRLVLQPLFSSYVFVCIAEKDIESLRNIPGIINVIYWKSKPAIINGEELELVRQITKNYTNIKLEKSRVDDSGKAKILDEPVIAYKENSVSVRYNTLKINLPSLGYTMIAERNRQKESVEYEQPGLLAFFPRRFNALFFN